MDLVYTNWNTRMHRMLRLLFGTGKLSVASELSRSTCVSRLIYSTDGATLLCSSPTTEYVHIFLLSYYLCMCYIISHLLLDTCQTVTGHSLYYRSLTSSHVSSCDSRTSGHSLYYCSVTSLHVSSCDSRTSGHSLYYRSLTPLHVSYCDSRTSWHLLYYDSRTT